MPLLDTSVLVDLLRRPRADLHKRAAQRISELRRSGLALSTSRLNVAELFVGVELSSNRAEELWRVEAVLKEVRVLELDDLAARRFGTISAYLRRQGRPCGDMDALIAAVTLVNGQTIVTRNPKHFSDIPGLTVESY